MKRTLTLKEMGIPEVKVWSKPWNRVNDINWHSVMFEPKRIRIADLTATQHTVALKGLVTTDPERRIYVVSIAGKPYIRDGHHRTVRAKLLGKKTIDAFVLELAK